MNKRGKIVIISGFSGVGKGTVVTRMMEKYPQDFSFSVSATTRAPRKGEVDGVHYFFISRDEFEQLLADEKMVEYNVYQGNYYGTPEAAVFEKLEQGVHVILEIDINGAVQVKKKYPEALSLFVLAPDAATLKARLEGRGTETPDQIRGRLLRAIEEAPLAVGCDTLIVNRVAEDCVEELRRVILDDALAKECYQNNLPLLRQLENDLKEMVKEK